MEKHELRVPSIRSVALAFISLGGRLIKSLIGPSHNTYHPERHYMRGPGPKCRQATSVSRRPSTVMAGKPYRARTNPTKRVRVAARSS